MKKKRILSALISAAMLAGTFAGMPKEAVDVDFNFSVSAEDVTYECGDNVTATLSDDGILTISGTGDMDDYYFDSNYNSANTPWWSVRKSIISIIIEDGVTSIGSSAFEDCESLSSITIPDSVTSIGSWAFNACDDLTSITIPDSVTSIGGSTFSSCESLTNITLPDSVTSIGSLTFYACESLTSITIPDSVTSIGVGAFTGTALLNNQTGVKYADKWIVVCDTDIASAEIKEGTRGIGSYAFSDCASLTSITIPDSVTSMGSSAFEGCTSLESITIPDSVTSIGCSAFEGCTSLISITIPDSVTSIGDRAFYGCESLTNITIPDSVTSIGNYAFFDCTSMASVTIGDGVVSIGKSAFSGCSAIAYTIIPDNVEYIGANAFKDTAMLKVQSGIKYADKWIVECNTDIIEVEIKDDTIGIAENAFMDCVSITNVTLPDSLSFINKNAFSSCESIESIVLGKSIEKISESTFVGCTALSDISISEKNQNYKVIDNVLYNKYQNVILLYPAAKIDTTYIVPDSVTEIMPYAFYNSGYLEELVIFENVTEFGEKAISSMSSGFKIHGVIDSVAHEYAKNNSITFDKSPILNKTDIQIMPGQDFLLELKNAVDTVVWVSNDRDIVTVDNGNVSAVSLGETVVNAVLGDDVYKCNVAVLENVVTTPAITTPASTNVTTQTNVSGTDVSGDKTTSSTTKASGTTSITTAVTTTATSSDNSVYLDIKENNGKVIIVNCEELIVNVVIPVSIDGKLVSEVSQYALSGEDIETVKFENPDVVIADSETTINKDAVIYGYWESTAHDYATKYNREFISLDEAPEGVTGDANGDGKVNVRDAAAIASALAKGLNDTLSDVSDFNGDGKVNVRDAAAIASALAKGEL